MEGLTLTVEQAEWFRKSIDMMNEMFSEGGETKSGYEVAKNIADELDDILTAVGR